jgi:RHS repeat-associated protein
MTNSTVLLATFFGRKRIGTFDRLGSAKYNQNNAAQSFYPYGEDRGTMEPNDSLKFATYTRDAATGLDYADQRYYANNFGRFMSVDPRNAGTLTDPKSLNRYNYVLDDPTNHQDPDGLCSVFIAGITEEPSGSSAEQQFEQGVGGITAYPYAGGGRWSGISSVIQQGLGIPNGATLTALEAIALAAQSDGPIDITTFSGGAAAFTAAWHYLTPEIQSRIQSITYIAPGSYQGLQTGDAGTSLTILNDAADLTNNLLNLFGSSASPPPGQSLTTVDTTPCGHRIDCILDNYGWRLELSGCDIGPGAVFGAAPNLMRNLVQAAFSLADPFGPPIIEYFYELPPIPSVTSTITYYQ